jgi:plastocyanin
MGVTGMTSELVAREATCAVCDRPVRAVVGTPSRHKVSAGTTVYAPVAWCMLDPCGHTFTVRRGGLIY